MIEELSRAFKLQQSGELISFVGAGGKTTAMFTLAEELKSKGKTVLITTTTAIYNPEDGFDYYFLEDIEDFSPSRGSIAVFGEKVKDSKLRGVSGDKIDSIYKRNIFDFILLEADGSKRKSIKAPRLGEPIVPSSTTRTIGLIGMDSLGKMINEENVHRVDLFLKILGKNSNDIIEADDIVKLVIDPDGLFKNSIGKQILILNKVESDKLDEIKSIKEKLTKHGFNDILIANINKKTFY